MTIIYVIEQLIDGEWVGIQTNFFNSIKNKKVSDKMKDALDNYAHSTLLDNEAQSKMTTLLNSLSSRIPCTIPIHKYKALVFKETPAYKRNRIASDHIVTGKGTNELLGMPPEFDMDKMRFVWWYGDFARTPVEERVFRLRA